MGQKIQHNHRVDAQWAGQRLDQIAVALLHDYSRGRIQQWIKSGELTVDGRSAKAKEKLHGGEYLSLSTVIPEDSRWEPQPIGIDVIYLDEHIIVLNKPAGLVVHPGAGTADGTLLNGLLYHYPELADIPRAGIVHRLDKDTTGLMVVARSLLAHTHLIQQLQARTVGREYEAITLGEMTVGGVINKPIGRHPTQRVKMAVLAQPPQRELNDTDTPPRPVSGKEAITHYRLLRRFKGYSYIACRLETGRTHQIRVHMTHLKFPLVGDRVYQGRQRWAAGTYGLLQQTIADFPRQALHARRLSLIHPKTQAPMHWETPLPEDMQLLLEQLKIHTKQAMEE